MSVVYLRLKSGEPVKDFCKRNGISYSTVYLRIDKGVDADQAVAEVLSMKGNGRCYNNCRYYLKSGESIAKACHKKGLNEDYCRKLIRVHGYTPDQAFKRMSQRLELKKQRRNNKND